MKDRKDRWEGLQTHGTDRGLPDLSIRSGLPTRNFKQGQFEEAPKIGGETMTDTILAGRGTCYSCIVRCKREVEVKEGPFRADRRYGGPEYETVAALGSNCGVSDLRAVAAANHLCNAHGLDTISGGMMVSFAMECFENGIINEKDTDGLELKFGSAEAMVKLVEMIVDRRGIGDLLAQGYEACIKSWGEAARPYALHVKGQPLPMHEPRFKYALGIGYAISATGADHCHNIHDTLFETDGQLDRVRPFGILEPMPAQVLGLPKVRLFYYGMHWELLKNMIGLCLFLPYTPNVLVDALQAITGWDTSLFELMKAAERGLALARAFNAREGLTAKDDVLPDRYFEAFESGPLAGKAPERDEFRKAMDAFYELARWDSKTGAPTAAKYAELDLDWVAEAAGP
jgi:aldehyde:ferredoxin oxidoreductase